MDKNITKKHWIIMAIILYLPFLLENFSYPLFMKIQPLWLSTILFFILYTYLFYGTAIFVYTKWRKTIGNPLVWKTRSLKWVFIALSVGILFRRLEMFILGESQIPMLVREMKGYLQYKPLWIGAAGYLLQFIYYLFEFTLTACIVDCAQKAAEKVNLHRLVPWGGFFLGLTWGIQHTFTQSSFLVGLACFFLSVTMGVVYVFSDKKPIYVFLVIAAAYLL